jgi:hypothetical protein
MRVGFRWSRTLPILAAAAAASAVAAAPAGAKPSVPAQDQPPTVSLDPGTTGGGPQECPPGTMADPTAVPTDPGVIVYPSDNGNDQGNGPQQMPAPATPLTCVPAMEQGPTPMGTPMPQPTSGPPVQPMSGPPAQPASGPPAQSPSPTTAAPQPAAPVSAMPAMPVSPPQAPGDQPGAGGMGSPPVQAAGAAAPAEPEVAALAAPVACPNPRLATRIRGPRTVAAGREATWRITVRNRCRLAASDLSLTYRIPAGFSLAHSAPRAALGSGVLRFRLDALAAGGGATVRLTLHAGRGLSGRRVQQAQVLSSCGASQLALAPITVKALVARVLPAVTG